LLIDAEPARGEDELVAAGAGALHAGDAHRLLLEVAGTRAARD